LSAFLHAYGSGHGNGCQKTFVIEDSLSHTKKNIKFP
jgi:hypothetical protein